MSDGGGFVAHARLGRWRWLVAPGKSKRNLRLVMVGSLVPPYRSGKKSGDWAGQVRFIRRLMMPLRPEPRESRLPFAPATPCLHQASLRLLSPAAEPSVCKHNGYLHTSRRRQQQYSRPGRHREPVRSKKSVSATTWPEQGCAAAFQDKRRSRGRHVEPVNLASDFGGFKNAR
jgi:hypothetical protein